MDPAPSKVPRFRKEQIIRSRFGSEQMATALTKAYSLAKTLNNTIYGQEPITEALQASVVRYLESFAHRKREPEHINLIGFTGSGKTALIERLSDLGVKVILLNGQDYVDGNEDKFAKEVSEKIVPAIEEGRPIILAVDELDKVPEIHFENGSPVEITSQFIGNINSILSEGRMNVGAKSLPLSKMMLITMMNYPPDQIDIFSKEILGKKKPFYDFNLEDFKKIDLWIKDNPGAKSRILARLFRPNTVSRLAPNSYFMQAFTHESYAQIVKSINREIERRYNDGPQADRHLKIHIEESMVDFVLKKGVVPSSGARETVRFANASLEQLISFAQKLPAPGQHGLDRPRKITIGMSADEKYARISVTPQVFRDGHLEDMKTFVVSIEYVPGTQLFRQPSDLVLQAPALQSRKKDIMDDENAGDSRHLTKKEIRAARFPKDVGAAKGLAKYLEQTIYDQNDTLNAIESDVVKYLSRDLNKNKEPLSRVLAGFPGNPALQILETVAKRINIPLVHVDLEEYAGDESSAVGQFLSAIDEMIRVSLINFEGEENSRFILVFEGLEKIYQRDALGSQISRPVTGFLSDLISKGRGNFSDFDEDYKLEVFTTDVSHGLIYVAMNLPVEKFGLEGDPRLTSVEDVERIFTRFTKHPGDLKDLFSSMYMPEVVSTILPRLSLLRPYSQSSYRKIIAMQVEKVVEDRFHDNEGVNIAQIQVKTSPAYMAYLYSESVIPSEGAKNTEAVVRNLFSTHLESAIDKLPRDRRYSGEPLVLKFDYDPLERAVKGTVSLAAAKSDKPLLILNQKVALMFPPLKSLEPMTPVRIHTAAHEFGHAFVAALLGMRMENIFAVPIKLGHGGFVSFKETGDSAAEEIAGIYVSLASRALERMVFNENPNDPLSVLTISTGASRDIEMATEALYGLIHEFGLTPHGGTLDRRAKFAPHDAATSFAPLSSEDVDGMGLLLRDLENFLVEELLQTHPMSWYIEKISRLAQEGSMTEKEFYQLVGYPFPGENRDLVYQNKIFEDKFETFLKLPAKEIQEARLALTGQNLETVETRLRRFVSYFARALEGRMNGNRSCDSILKTNE